MPQNSELQITRPEERELEAKRSGLAALESSLAEREVELASLRAELASFERKYLAEVGLRYAELDELKAQVSEKAAAEQPGDSRLQEAARKARARAKATRSTAGPGRAHAQKVYTPTPEIKRLYREVARRIHPDLTTDDADRTKRQDLMAQANQAYMAGNQAALTRVFEAYECSPENVRGDGAGADLVRTIRRISQVKARLEEIDAEMKSLRASDAKRLRNQFDGAAASGRDLFSDLANRIDAEIAAARANLSEQLQCAHT
jgi:DNA repair exonuclease SbcCD ATPase subunit